MSCWYSRWLESLSTVLIFPGKRFGKPYLPPVGLGRSFETFFHHDGGVKANHFYKFCNFLCPVGTLGGLKVSQPSLFFLTNNLACHTCHQGAWEDHSSHFPILTMVLGQPFIEIFLQLFVSRWYSKWLESVLTFLIFLVNILVCHNCHQGAMEDLGSQKQTLTLLKWLKITKE